MAYSYAQQEIVSRQQGLTPLLLADYSAMSIAMRRNLNSTSVFPRLDTYRGKHINILGIS